MGQAILTDRLGSVGGPARYYPYGQERQATPEGTEKFASYYRDETYYTAAWGRFMQADPYLAPDALKNPQGWNRYANVENDPVNWYDPSGLLALCPLGTVTAPDDRSCRGIYEWFTRWYETHRHAAYHLVVLGYATLDPWFDRPTAGASAAKFRDEMLAGTLKDSEALAAFATERASALAIQGVNVTSSFVQDFGVFVDGDHPMVKLADAAGAPVAAVRDPVYLRPVGESGYKPEYRDSLDPGSDQAHHFAAFFQCAYFAGEWLGRLAAILTDRFPDNPGDRALGQRAAELGARLRRGEIEMWSVGFWISELCR